MKEPILSIIIPVYNLENYIKPCLDSIYSQMVSEHLFEVVAVDDGSSDKSLECLNEYACMHNNLVVLSQRNGGVSSARNHALRYCKGTFVTFLDADDEIYHDSIHAIFNSIAANDTFDIMYCRGFKRYSKTSDLCEVHPWQHLFNEQNYYTDRDLSHAHFINGGSVCGGIFRKSFFEENKLWFAEGVANGEDTIFTYLMYARHPRVVFRNIRLNIINVREGSATHSCTMERIGRIENNVLYLISQRSSSKNDSAILEAIDRAAYHSIMLAIEMYLSIEGKRDCKRLYHILHINEICPIHIKNPQFHQRVKTFLLNTNFRLCLKLIEWESKKNRIVNCYIRESCRENSKDCQSNSIRQNT